MQIYRAMRREFEEVEWEGRVGGRREEDERNKCYPESAVSEFVINI